MGRAASAAVSATSAVAAATTAAFDLHMVASLLFGTCGVVLARVVFVDRENRRLRRAQTLRETVPLTLVAVLICFALIVEYDLNLPKAIFVGLGVGWVAIAFLDVIGDRLLGLFAPSRVKLTDMSGLDNVPGAMRDLTDLVDRADALRRVEGDKR